MVLKVLRVTLLLVLKVLKVLKDPVEDRVFPAPVVTEVPMVRMVQKVLEALLVTPVNVGTMVKCLFAQKSLQPRRKLEPTQPRLSVHQVMLPPVEQLFATQVLT